MGLRRIRNYICLFVIILLLVAPKVAVAAEYQGQVISDGLPVPGATVSVAQDGKEFSTTTDQQGRFFFPELMDGTWTIQIQMTGFLNIKQDVVISTETPPGIWDLKMLAIDQIKADIEVPIPSEIASSPAANSAPKPQENNAVNTENKTAQEDLNQLASDGLLINGSVNNGAVSPFAQIAAFGNNRNSRAGLYTGGIGVIWGNSALDARPFSLSGQNTPKAHYNQVTGVATFGGPLNIPHVFRTAPTFFVGYQRTRNRDADTDSALVPDALEREGDFSHEVNAVGQPLQVLNPTTGLPFPGDVVPISPQAEALLKLYPLPNIEGNPRYNYQTPIISNLHRDAIQSRFEKTAGRKDDLFGTFALLSSRTDSPNLFGFLDKTDILGTNVAVTWSHRFAQRLFLDFGYRFNRISIRDTPYWENRENVSGQAGITGNNQEPMNWGPPTLAFSGGIAELSDMQSSFDRNQTSAFTSSILWNHNRHNFRFGGDFRRQEFNYLSQQDPRGTFTFTGAASQSDFADFLLGTPDASSIAFGNADKYFRQSVYDAYFTDDWRMSPQFTLNAGLRWEYGAPITELYGRLVNLDIAPGFSAVSQILATDPVAPLTNETLPSSLIRPDKRIFEPRVGIAWRPISGSSLVVRAGYGIYSDTSVYQAAALQMAQQPPISKNLSVQNSPLCPLTLKDGFNPCSSTTGNTFAVDSNFRVGYAQNWQLSIQRDLPGSLQLTATYIGIKGTHGPQEFLPNTFPIGATNPCPSCPIGFVYLTSGGNSTREAAQLQLRRRLHEGLTATLRYTFSKSIDNDSAIGGQGAILPTQDAVPNSSSGGGSLMLTSSNQTSSPPTIAQNWLDLSADRGLSSFDQRHLLNLQLQYTTGMGIGGRTLLSGWKGLFCKEWTLTSQLVIGSGLPQTPVYLASVPITGTIGSIRPDYTGAPIYSAPPGLSLNPAAYTAPSTGQWGDAGKNSIVGPNEFTLDASIGRTFRLKGRFNLDFRMDSTNLLNHVTFTTWNTTVNSSQFGLPLAANAMRSIQSTLRLRF